MKKLFPFIAIAIVVVLVSCGKAAEDREQMHARAKVFQDSIANMIRVSMAEAEGPSNVQVVPPPAAPAVTPMTTPVAPTKK